MNGPKVSHFKLAINSKLHKKIFNPALEIHQGV